MADKQLLHLVIGGELKALEGPAEFRDLSKVDFVGAFPNYSEALAAWRNKAQSTVDNALMRYFIIHAHKLLDPESDHPHEH
jgi:myo-inositol-1(or 4)-monophosphatase